MSMRNYNVQPRIVGATDPTPPGLAPAVAELARDPVDGGSLTASEKEAAFAEARRLASWDSTKNRKIVERDGDVFWAREYPTAFTFNGQLRSEFDWVNKDPAKRTPGQQTAAMRAGSLEGPLTDVIIETEDGEQVIIRKRNEATSAQLQEFDVVSTVMAAEAAVKGEKLQPRQLHSNVLDGVVLVPGMPIRLAVDPDTKGLPWTDSKIARITGLQFNEHGKVPLGHPDLKPEKYSSARERFNEAIRAKTKRSATLGSAAITRS